MLVGAAQVRGRAQRVRARDAGAPGLRRGALQPELHALEPRRLRGRAARDEARAGARPVLRRAEVRAGDRPRVRGSRPLDPARSRRGAARPRRTSRTSRSTRGVLDSLFTTLAPARRRPTSRVAGDGAPTPYAMAADYLGDGAVRARRGRGEPRAAARRAARGRATRCSATSTRGRACTARRSSATARRSAEATEHACGRAIGEARRAAGDGSRRARRARSPRRCWPRRRRTIEVLMLVAAARAETGDPAGGARRRSSRRAGCAPLRADVHQQHRRHRRARWATSTARSPRIATRSSSTRTSPSCATSSRSCCAPRASCAEAEQELDRGARRRADVRRGDARAQLAAPRGAAARTTRSTCSIALLERDPYHFDALLALGETLLAIGRKRDARDGVRARPALRPGARRRAVLRRACCSPTRSASARRSSGGAR